MFKKKLDGTYEIDTKILVDGTYKHLHKGGYPTLGAAKADFENAKQQFLLDHAVHHKANTFDELFAEYEKWRSFKVERSTTMADESINKIYFGMFKGKMIKDVFNATIIKFWYESLANNTTYSNSRKSLVITRMKDILKFAYQHKYIDAAIYQDCDVLLLQVKHSKRVLKERVAWTDEEQKAFLQACKDENERDYLMFSLFVALGARLGEFLALMPKCIDFEKNRIGIFQQVRPIKDSGATLSDKLKTQDSYRTVLIDKDIINDLKHYIETICIKDDEFLFFSFDKSSPMGRNTFRRKLRHYCTKANVRQINPHCVRHTMATRLASLCHNATDIEAASKMLGHSTTMFMQTYANHNTEVAERNLCSKLWNK